MITNTLEENLEQAHLAVADAAQEVATVFPEFSYRNRYAYLSIGRKLTAEEAGAINQLADAVSEWRAASEALMAAVSATEQGA